MNYGNKRRNKKLTAYQVRTLLGLDKRTYSELERGQRELEKDLINKWSEIMANANELKTQHYFKMVEVNNWFKNGEFSKRMKELGYTQKTLCERLQIAPSTMSGLVNGKDTMDDIKEEIYDFLQNRVNKFVDGKKPIKIMTFDKKNEKSLDKEIEELFTEREIIETKDEPLEQEKVCEEKNTSENELDTNYLLRKIDYLLKENQELKKQVERYNKLIDRM